MKKIIVKLKEKKTEPLFITTDFIRLDAAMKLSGCCSTGGEAKMVITDGLVKVNSEKCEARGRKLHEGDSFEYKYTVYEVKK